MIVIKHFYQIQSEFFRFIKSHQKILPFIVVGLVIFFHLGAMLIRLSDLAMLNSKKDLDTKNEPIKITFIPPASSEVDKNSNAAKKQIVQTQDSDLEYKKTKDQFLTEKNNYFERQTVARNVDVFKNVKAGSLSANQKSKEVTTNTQSKAEKSHKEKNINKRLNLKDLAVSDLGAIPKMEDQKTQNNSTNPQNQKKSVTQNAGQSGQGVSSTNDYVKDIALGDFTKLNGQEFKHYGFYNRIRQKLEQFWGRNIQDETRRIFSRGGRMVASESHVTSLAIFLNEQGEIVKVKINSSSGYQELDKAATDAFNQAGPFPNPPKDMFVNGLVKIEWGFVVNT